LEGLETATKAWRLLQGLIEHSRVPARGMAVDRRAKGRDGFVDTVHPPGILPPDAVGDLGLWDAESCETWLRPQNALFGQGRHWRNVKVHLPSLKQALRGSSSANPMKAGRKPSYCYQTLGKETFRLLEHHGDLSPDDPEWNSKEDLIAALQDFYKKKHRREPPRTTLQPYVNRWLSEWRARNAAEN
jgi:hypothetical protein